jgi:hypothetical protein
MPQYPADPTGCQMNDAAMNGITPQQTIGNPAIRGFICLTHLA